MSQPVVLIVEDEPQLSLCAEAILKDLGYRAITASTVAEALSIIVSVQRLDVLFTDIALQDEMEGGVTVGKVFAECHPGLPVLYATGGGVSNRMRASFAEPYGFIAKPYSAEQLRIAVNNLRTSSRQSYS